MTLQEYYTKEMQDWKGKPEYKSETESAIIFDYQGSYEFKDEDIEFLKQLDYTEDDFVDYEYKSISVNGEEETVWLKEYHDRIEIHLFGGSMTITYPTDKYTKEDAVEDVTKNYKKLQEEDYDFAYRCWCD